MKRCLLGVVLILAAAGAAPKATVSLVVRCNEGLAETLRPGAESYMALHPEVKLTVLAAPPLRCVKAVAEGTADLALSTRVDPDQLEEALGKAAGHLEFQPIVRGALVFYVNQSNPLTGMSLTQLRQVYSGQFSNWKQVGGPNLPIHLLSEDGTSGLYDNLRHDVLLPDQPVSPQVEWVRRGELLRRLESDPAALGYGGSSLNPVHSRQLTLNGVAPGPESLTDGSYPAQRDICLVSIPSASAEARQFATYLVSPEGFETWRGKMVRLK